MSEKQIIQEAINQVGRDIGKLQGKLFAAEAKTESLRAQVQRLDAVYQGLKAQLQEKPVPTPAPKLTAEELHEALLERLPSFDPASQQVCLGVIGIVMNRGATQEDRQKAVALMESHAWKQGEAYALAQQVVQCLRS